MTKYAMYLGSVLSSRVDEMQGKALTILSLRDELAVLQTICGEVFQGYANAVEIIQSKKDMKVEDADRVMAIARGRAYDALNQIRDMTLAAKRVEESGTQQVDLNVLHATITQIVEIVDDELQMVEQPLGMVGHSMVGVMDRIADRARQQLLTVRDIPKTSLTPERLDAEVRAMHDTIPDVRLA